MTTESPLVLLDAVDFGLAASEAAREISGQTTWLENEAPRSYVGGPDVVVAQRPVAHLRDVFRTLNVTLAIPPTHRGAGLVLDLALRDQPLGDAPQRPARLLAVTDRAVWELARFVYPEKWVWRHFRVRVPAEVAHGPTLTITLEANDNYVSPDVGHGKSIGYVRLLGPERPAAEAQGARPAAAPPDPTPEIALVMPPVWDVMMPPLSPAILNAFLKGSGVRSRAIDLNLDLFREVPAKRRWLWHANNCMLWGKREFTDEKVWPWLDEYLGRAARRLVATGVPVLGFFLATTTMPIARRLAARIKEIAPDRRIVLGGPGLPNFPVADLGDAWDFLVYGAGEHALAAIARGETSPIPGVVRRGDPADPSFDPVGSRAKLLDLESLPLVDFDDFPLAAYLEPWRLPMLTSRGCIHRCAYCFDARFYAPYRRVSGARAFEQVEFLVRRHGRTHFEFTDLLCNGDLDSLAEMSRLLAASDLGATWGSFAVIRGDMTAEYFRLLARGGCKRLHYGFETGSDRMLAAMNRGYTAADAERVLRDTRAAGIQVVINLLVGFPGETDETVDETIAFLARNARYVDRVETVNPVYMMVASDLVRRAGDFGLELTDGAKWTAHGVGFDKRTEWIYRLMAEVTRAGVPCYQAVHQDFSIVPESVA